MLLGCSFRLYGRYGDEAMKFPGTIDFNFDAGLTKWEGEWHFSELHSAADRIS